MQDTVGNGRKKYRVNHEVLEETRRSIKAGYDLNTSVTDDLGKGVSPSVLRRGMHEWILKVGIFKPLPTSL